VCGVIPIASSGGRAVHCNSVAGRRKVVCSLNARMCMRDGVCACVCGHVCVCMCVRACVRVCARAAREDASQVGLRL
jgi:hypothetical protein